MLSSQHLYKIGSTLEVYKKLIFSVLIIFIVFLGNAFAEEGFNTISGNVVLPQGAPVEGLSVLVSASNEYGVVQNLKYVVRFEENETSKSYELPVPQAHNSNWNIFYECLPIDLPIGCDDYMADGRPSQVTIASSIDHTGIDITLIEKTRIEGTITFPLGFVEQGGFFGRGVEVVAVSEIQPDQGESYFGLIAHIEEININYNEGSNTATFSLKIPRNSSQVRIAYRCTNACLALGYNQIGYYSESGTVLKLDQSTAISSLENHTDINLTMIDKAGLETVKFTGQVVLAQASNQRFDVVVIARNKSLPLASYSQVIPFNNPFESFTPYPQTHKPYELEVIRDETSNWEITYEYYCQGSECFDIEPFGSVGEVQGGVDNSGLDILLLERNTRNITGSVTLPVGMDKGEVRILAKAKVTENGITEYVDVGSTSINMGSLSGANAASFILNIPDEDNMQIALSYQVSGLAAVASSGDVDGTGGDCSDCGYLSSGYYSQTGTVINAEDATLLSPAGSLSDINIEIPRIADLENTNTISGNVVLALAAPEGGMVVGIDAFDPENRQGSSVAVAISEGQIASSYELKIPHIPGSNWQLHYHCISGCQDHLNVDFSSASVSVAGDIDSSGIDISLTEAVRISGQVIFPRPVQTYQGKLRLDVIAEVEVVDDNGSTHYQQISSTNLLIEREGTKASYALKVPLNANQPVRLSYRCFNCQSGFEQYLSEGFYNNVGTVREPEEATYLSASNHLSGINLNIPSAQGGLDRRIEGIITVPAGISGAIYINAESQEGERFYHLNETSINVNTTANSGVTTYEYALIVPQDNRPLRVHYQCVACSNLGYLYQGYYHSEGSVGVADEASVLSPSVVLSNINLNIPDISDFTTDKVSGQVTLDKPAPAGGLSVDIRAARQNSSERIAKTVNFLEGQSSLPYELDVIHFEEGNWDIFYHCTIGCDDYFIGGLVDSVSSGVDHTGIDIAIAALAKVEGALTFPVGFPGVINIRVEEQITVGNSVTFNPVGGIGINLDEVAGTDSINYTVTYPPKENQQIRVSYQCVHCENFGFSSLGYYSQAGTVESSDVASILSNGSSLSAINLNIIPSTGINADDDQDGISNNSDNCPAIQNHDQANADNDLLGDVCDPDDDNDEIPDVWENIFGLNPFDASDALDDPDGDGVSNMLEYLGNSDPRDSASVPRATQSVSVSNSVSEAVIGQPFTLRIDYSNSRNDETLTGLGVRIHFNSQKLTWLGFENLLDDIVGQDSAPIPDNQDLDNNPNTDHYINIGWANQSGQWPNQVLPAKLYDVLFEFKQDVGLQVGDTTLIGFSSSATANGYDFNSTVYPLTVAPAFTWDIDGDGEAKPLTDGLLVLRYLFDFHGDVLINDAVGIDATRTNAVEIETLIQEGIDLGILDIDGNGETKPLTDGLLLLRYLFDFTDEPLTDNAVDNNATRLSSVDIEDYLETYLPIIKRQYSYSMSDNSFEIGEQPYTIDAGMEGNRLWSNITTSGNGHVVHNSSSNHFYIVPADGGNDIKTIQVLVRVRQSGVGRGGAGIVDNTTNEQIFVVGTESKNVVVEMKTNYKYRVSVSAALDPPVAGSNGSIRSYRSEMSFHVVN